MQKRPVAEGVEMREEVANVTPRDRRDSYEWKNRRGLLLETKNADAGAAR